LEHASDLGFILSGRGRGQRFRFDLRYCLIHWMFGLHHLTNTQMDLVLEPLLVLLGLVLLWFAITLELRDTK
jgi:hypothetical protein